MLEGYESGISNTKNKDFNSLFGIGYLAFYEKDKVTAFIDKDSKVINLSRVHFVSNSFNKEYGQKKNPKPFIIQSDGKTKKEGEKLIYTHLSPTEILIIGSDKIYRDHYDKNLNTDFFDHEDIEETADTKSTDNFYRLIKEDKDGNFIVYMEAKEKGESNVILKIKGSKENGKFILDTNGIINLTQRDENENLVAQIKLDNTSGSEKLTIVDKFDNKIEVNEKGTIVNTKTIRIGETSLTLKKILDDLFNAIQKMTHNTPTGATIPTPLNWSEFEKIKSDLAKFMDVQ